MNFKKTITSFSRNVVRLNLKTDFQKKENRTNE